MFRLGQDAALTLMDRIDSGDHVYNVNSEMQLTGTDMYFEPSRLPQPTDAQPGTNEKIECLRARIERGESLWHPQDRTQYSRDIRCDCTPICEVAVA